MDIKIVVSLTDVEACYIAAMKKMAGHQDKPHMMGVFIDNRNLMGTDGHRMHVVEHGSVVEDDQFGIIRGFAITELLKSVSPSERRKGRHTLTISGSNVALTELIGDTVLDSVARGFVPCAIPQYHRMLTPKDETTLEMKEDCAGFNAMYLADVQKARGIYLNLTTKQQQGQAIFPRFNTSGHAVFYWKKGQFKAVVVPVLTK